MKAEVKLRDFVYYLKDLYYEVVKKYFFQVEVKSYKMFYSWKGDKCKNIEQTAISKI